MTTHCTSVALRPLAPDTPSLGATYGRGLSICRRDGGEIDLCERCGADPTGGVASPAPFPHWLFEEVFAPPEHEALLSWVEGCTAWRPTDGGFYRADVLGLEHDEQVPLPLRNKLAPSSPRWPEALAERVFGIGLTLQEPIAVHRMATGHGVGIHTDEPGRGGETHRIVVTICRPRLPAAGGHFLLLAGERPEAARRLLPLVSNAGVAFPLTAESHHAITLVRAGARYSVVMSFGAR